MLLPRSSACSTISHPTSYLTSPYFILPLSTPFTSRVFGTLYEDRVGAGVGLGEVGALVAARRALVAARRALVATRRALVAARRALVATRRARLVFRPCSS